MQLIMDYVTSVLAFRTVLLVLLTTSANSATMGTILLITLVFSTVPRIAQPAPSPMSVLGVLITQPAMLLYSTVHAVFVI
jgi:hypothetical protein